MITFGYKTRISSILRACLGIGVGLVMTVPSSAEDSVALVVKIIAAILFAAGFISLVYGFVDQKSGVLPVMVINSVVDVALGVMLFLFPTQIGSVIVYVLGAGLLVLAVLQLLVFIGTLSLLGGGLPALLLSLLAICGAVLLIFNPFSLRVMSLLAGVCFIAYGIQEIIAIWRVPRAVREYEELKAWVPEDYSAPESDGETEGKGSYYEDDVKEVDFEKE